jgi:TM2 domain-containing membrane protein YozV
MRSPFANRHKLEMQAYATPKKVWLAVLLNLVPLIFGLGFLYLDRLGRFFLVFSMQMLILFSLTAFGNPQFHLFLLGLLWLFSILDAYWQAKAHNDNLELI